MKQGNNTRENKHNEERRATATISVHKYESTVYDDPKEGPTLTKTHLEESFTGDIEGYGVVDILQANIQANDSSSFIGIERIIGKIGEREGTFLLQVAGTIEAKMVRCDWFVIPGSGTRQLSGLRGEGGFQAKLGEGGEVHLDYWFT